MNTRSDREKAETGDITSEKITKGNINYLGLITTSQKKETKTVLRYNVSVNEDRRG